MTQAEQHIKTMVEAIGRRWFRLRASWFLSVAGAAALAWLFVMILVDNVAMLTAGQLLVGWSGLCLGAMSLGAWALYGLTVRRPRPDRLALMYESRRAGLRNRLINAVQFIESRQTQRDPMAQAVVIENARSLDLRTAPQAVSFRPVRNALLALGIGAVVLLGYVVVRPGWSVNALARVLHPLRPRAHMLATEPAVTPGDTRLIEGEPLTVRAVVPPSQRGDRPEIVYLEYRIAELDWTQVTMAAESASDSAYRFPVVRHPLDYRVRAGRSVSPTYHVEVRYRPRVEHVEVSVTRPEYAGGGTRRLKAGVGDVAALTGSTIAVDVTASADLARGHIELTGAANVPLKIGPRDPRRGSAGFKLTRSGSYAIHVQGTDQLTSFNPPRYTLTAEPDQPPVAIITRPGRDLIMPANTGVPLAIEAEDDIGLARITLQTRTGTGDWKDAQQWDIPQREVRHRAAGAHLSLGELGLKPNDVLLYRVVAHDHCQPQPNVGVGRTWSITVGEPNDSPSLLADQTRRLLEALRQILALQRENRTELDMDRAVEPIRARQVRVRRLTQEAIDEERKSLRPTLSVIDELVALADGPMLQAAQRLDEYGGTYAQRLPLKPPILKLMDDIIARLEALIGRVSRALELADKAREAIEPLGPAEREQALKRIHDLLDKLRTFIPEQDKVIEQTEELVRKGENLTDDDLKRIEQLKGTEDKWAKVFTDSVKDIHKLTEQGFADRSIANDYKEMVEQIEAASLNLTPELIELAVPREQSGREMAESLVEEMEMWLPHSPDHIKWLMEEPLDTPEIPMVELPDQLWDLVGDLIEDQGELNAAAEDLTSAWADSLAKGAGWDVMGGPISNFSAVGKTGNQLPDDNELSGRAGDGRSGRSQGQLVEDVAKGLAGRQTPTRITNDPYEQGVVKELQQMATGGATGGGKARGSGQEGLQGQSPPPLVQDVQFMKDWQQRIRQKAERTVGQLTRVRLSFPEIQESIRQMKRAEKAAEDGRYAEMFKHQQMVLQYLQMAGDLAAREVALRVHQAVQIPPDQRRQVLDAMDEPVPQEYQDAVWRYFQQLSEAP